MLKKFFDNLSIRYKILLLFSSVFLVVVLMVLFWFPLQMKTQARDALQDKARSLAEMTAYTSVASLDFNDPEAMAQVITTASRDETVRFMYFYDMFGEEFATFNDSLITELELPLTEYYETNEEFNKEIGLYQVVFRPIRNFEENQVGALLMGFSREKVVQSIRTNIIFTFIFSFLLLAIGFSATFYISGLITNRLNLVITVVNKVADGNLSEKIMECGNDELGKFAQTFNIMIDNMQEIIGKVQQAVFKLDSSVKDIQDGVQHQATTSTQQSASISETTATMEELAQTSRQIAQNADSVVDVAKQTENSAQSGVNAANDTFSKMEEVSAKNQENISEMADLGKKSERIHEIMEIINTITDQTKLIAFNAAIEAAGAGESGRRFAIVATEIRRLADDTEKSTAEIKSKINEIQRAVNRLVIASEEETRRLNEGVKFTQLTVNALEEILNGARATTSSAKEISLATQQQRTASEQIVGALKETREATKHYVVTANQTSVITNDLAAMSDELKKLISRFKV